LVRCYPDVSSDLPKEDRRNVATAVERQGGLSPVWMTILPVRASLPDERESEALEEPFDFPWLQHGNQTHA
jgi:hypothetical protein